VLIKWKNLPHSMCSWEKPCDIRAILAVTAAGAGGNGDRREDAAAGSDGKVK
jgi:hypothetical protein